MRTLELMEFKLFTILRLPRIPLNCILQQSMNTELSLKLFSQCFNFEESFSIYPLGWHSQLSQPFCDEGSQSLFWFYRWANWGSELSHFSMVRAVELEYNPDLTQTTRLLLLCCSAFSFRPLNQIFNWKILHFPILSLILHFSVYVTFSLHSKSGLEAQRLCM